MAIFRGTDRVRWPLWVAAPVLACQILAWWWAASTSGGPLALLGPALLSGAGVLLALFAHPHRTAAVKQIDDSTPEIAHLHDILSSGLDTMRIGLEIWDLQDRLLLYNPAINQIAPGLHSPDHIGQTYEVLMREHIMRKLVHIGSGNERTWLARHMANRGQRMEPRLLALAGARWVNCYESRSPEGYLVVAWVDVTKLMHKDIALETANLNLARQSTMDALTGLANRRRFDETLHEEWHRASRAGLTLSLLMVDIDYFKNYNDHYGHLAGDECLKRVAMVLERCVRRAGEIVARFGGEEFVILLPGSDLAHAHETAQNCLDLMKQEDLPHAASQTCHRLTISIGVACVLPDATRDPFSLVNAADAAMYRAKSTGRAHYEVADQADWEIEPDTPRTQPAALH